MDATVEEAGWASRVRTRWATLVNERFCSDHRKTFARVRGVTTERHDEDQTTISFESQR